MRESHAEGVATHSGPEPCVGVREGAGDDAVVVGGRQHRWPRYREWSADPARSKNLRMHGISARENREVPWSPVAADAAPPMVGWRVGGEPGREGNAEAVRP